MSRRDDRLPPGALGPVMVATLRAVDEHPLPSTRSVAFATGCTPPTAWLRLDELRMAGLVSWEPRKAGTLRVVVESVPFGNPLTPPPG